MLQGPEETSARSAAGGSSPEPQVANRQRACNNPACRAVTPQENPGQLAPTQPGLRRRPADSISAPDSQAPPPAMSRSACPSPPPWTNYPGNVAERRVLPPVRHYFIGVALTLIIRTAKESRSAPYLVAPHKTFRRTSPFPRKRPDPVGTGDAYSNPCTWSFTNWTGDGNICESVSRNGNADCWPRWLTAGSKRPSSWWAPGHPINNW